MTFDELKVVQKAKQKVGKPLKLGGAAYIDKKATKKLNSKLGGAISANVRKLDVFTPALDYKHILREAAMLQGPLRPKQYLHGLPDMIPRNQLGAHTTMPLYTSEVEFHRSLVRGVSGRGASGDHPSVIRAVGESLKHKPELFHHYMNS